MKKMLLAAVGLAGVLASCGGASLTVGNGYYGDYNTSSQVTLSSLTEYTTDQQLSTDVSDSKTGQTLRAGTYVICDNTPTSVFFNVNWTGNLNTVGFQFKGYKTGNYINTDEYSVTNPLAGSARAGFTLDVGTAPLSINKQAINVVPRVDILGYTYVRAQGRDANGYSSNVIQTDYSIPVVTCFYN